MNMHASQESARRVALLMRQRDALYAYILACLRNHADAEDILQVASVAVMTADQAPLEERQFAAWIREIARRRMLEHFRRTKRLVPLDPQVLIRLSDAAATVESEESEDRRKQALRSCVEELPEKSRAFLMARYDGSAIDTAGLAQQFHRSEQGVYSFLYRLRSLLRECVERRLKAGVMES